MDSPPPFRQSPKPQERLLPFDQQRAQNEALTRQVQRVESVALLSRQSQAYGLHSRQVRNRSIPPRYALPIVVFFFCAFVLPFMGIPGELALTFGVGTAIALFFIALVGDVKRSIHK